MLAEPWNVVFLADGRLLVADASAFDTGGLVAIDPANGQQTKVASSSRFRSPFGLASRPTATELNPGYDPDGCRSSSLDVLPGRQKGRSPSCLDCRVRCLLASCWS
jgi:hypothetical protein